MALKDQVKALIDAGITESDIKQALRAVMDEKQVAENDAGMVSMPTLDKKQWDALKANLQSPAGPTNLFQMTTMVLAALDADDQPMLWQGLRGVFNAAWGQHPGLRQDLRMRNPLK
jgi:hypothetical protein